MDADKTLSLEELEQIDKKDFHDGLSKLFIYHLQDGEAVHKKSVPPELSERLVSRYARDIASRV